MIGIKRNPRDDLRGTYNDGTKIANRLFLNDNEAQPPRHVRRACAECVAPPVEIRKNADAAVCRNAHIQYIDIYITRIFCVKRVRPPDKREKARPDGTRNNFITMF